MTWLHIIPLIYHVINVLKKTKHIILHSIAFFHNKQFHYLYLKCVFFVICFMFQRRRVNVLTSKRKTHERLRASPCVRVHCALWIVPWVYWQFCREFTDRRHWSDNSSLYPTELSTKFLIFFIFSRTFTWFISLFGLWVEMNTIPFFKAPTAELQSNFIIWCMIKWPKMSQV